MGVRILIENSYLWKQGKIEKILLLHLCLGIGKFLDFVIDKIKRVINII